MLRTTVAVGLCVVSMGAWALDVDTAVAVSCDGRPIVKQVNTFVGLTPAEDAALNKRGNVALDMASKAQDKGGPCTIIWQWGAQPAIETRGMRLNDVNRVLRAGVKWLDSVVEDSERAEKGGKKRPWGG